MHAHSALGPDAAYDRQKPVTVFVEHLNAPPALIRADHFAHMSGQLCAATPSTPRSLGLPSKSGHGAQRVGFQFFWVFEVNRREVAD
jgi:hypothetical protein